ncbi:MAG: MerR family transcriptional regulator [Aquihabitans sp.]
MLVREAGAMTQNYSGKKAAEIVGISYRQLDYWARTDLIRPSVADAAGSGSRRQYSYRDLLELKVVKSMLDAGIKLESVRTAFEYLRVELGENVSSARLVIGGGKAILVRDDAELLDVINTGQFVMTSLLSLDGVQAEIDAAVRELSPATKEAVPATTAPQAATGS